MNIPEKEMWQTDFIFIHTHHLNCTELTLWGLRKGCEPQWILEEIMETLWPVTFVSIGTKDSKAGGWKSSGNWEQKWKSAKETILKDWYCKTHMDFLSSDKTNKIWTSLWNRAPSASRCEGRSVVTGRRRNSLHGIISSPAGSPCCLIGLWDRSPLACDVLAEIQKGLCSFLKGVDISIVSDSVSFMSQRASALVSDLGFHTLQCNPAPLNYLMFSKLF